MRSYTGLRTKNGTLASLARSRGFDSHPEEFQQGLGMFSAEISKQQKNGLILNEPFFLENCVLSFPVVCCVRRGWFFQLSFSSWSVVETCGVSPLRQNSGSTQVVLTHG